MQLRTPAPALLLAAALGATAATAADAHARDAVIYQTDKSFGLGIMLGAPTGLTGKYFLGDSSMAIDFALGAYDDDFYYDDAVQLHADVLWHPAVLASSRGFTMPLYVGVGARIVDHDDFWFDGRYYDGHSHAGLRVPIGIAFDLTRAPLDIFAELVPVWDFAEDDDGFDYHDHDGLDLTGAVGLRYYF